MRSKSTQIPRQCAACGDVFLVQPYKLKIGRGLYCSIACRDRGRARPIQRPCGMCGKAVMRPQCHARTNRIYCSRECYWQSLRIDAETRFWTNVEKTESCWIWKAKTAKGYGYLSVNGKSTRAHRFSWELHNGPIPDGMIVCHNCPSGDNPGCVNPTHLWLGTDAENAADKTAKGRARNRHTGPILNK
jgi:hypothetical protein